MTYVICTQPLSPRMDTLPTYKITDYPLEKRGYKPFAQTKLCVTPNSFIIHMWAFESNPKPESQLKFVLTTQQSTAMLYIHCNADGTVSAYTTSPTDTTPISINSTPIKGEDLQGEFWGSDIQISITTLEKIFGNNVLKTGNTVLCNMYKLSENKNKPHKGSLHPANFAEHKEYGLSSLAKFTVVNY